MKEYFNTINKLLSIGALIFTLLALVSAFAFGVYISADTKYPNLVIVDVMLAKIAIILSFVTLASILISRKYFKGLIYLFIASILASPLIYLDIKAKEIAKYRNEMSKKYSGEYNLRLLGKELKKYAKANNNCLPSADRWCDCLMEFNKKLTKDNFKHPKAPVDVICNYAFNKNLNKGNITEISEDTILLFESAGEWNLNGKQELLNPRFKNDQWLFVLYFNGTVRVYWFSEGNIRDYKSKYGQVSMYYTAPRWDP